MPRQRRTLGTPFIKFDRVGQIIVGTLIDRVPMKFPNGDSFQYGVEIDGVRHKMNGTQKIDDAIAEVEMPMLISIEYIGDVQTLSGNKLKDYIIEEIYGDEQEEAELDES